MYTLEEIDRILEKFARLQNISREPANLYEPLDYMMSVGGKRIRPKLCLLTANLFREELDAPIIFPAMALEVFHEFTLIHDDIMDRSDTRRGRPTVWKQWDENIAILSGDVMSILACKYLAYAGKDILPQALDLFTTTAMQVCEGQQYDMDYERLPFITMDDYLGMIGLKTAVLLACSAKMGALLGGAAPEVSEAVYDFGYQLGIAFQIADDYLDTFGNEKVFGKRIGGDIANNKKTWLLVEAFHRADGERKQRLEKALQLPEEAREEKIGIVRDIYVESGVGAAAEAAILARHKEALASLRRTGLESGRTAVLERFAEELLHRDK